MTVHIHRFAYLPVQPTLFPSIQCGKKETVPTIKGQKAWSDKDSDQQALIDIVWNQVSSRFADLQQTGAFHAFDGAWQILAPVLKAIFRDEFAEMLGEKHNQNARNAYIKAVAWHPHREILAVAHQDDVVFVYQLEGHKWNSRMLSHEFMVDVSSMEWKYRSAGTLAVGAR